MRVTRFFTWKAGDWDSKTNTEGSGVMSEVRIEGYTAYAKRQAALYRYLAVGRYSRPSHTYAGNYKQSCTGGTWRV
jgi:hypothetical protein